jgi:hypothetical protein
MATPDELRWIRQWQEAGPALEEQKRRDLRALTAERALRASDSLLDLTSRTRLSDERRTHSGLVEQQRLFHRRPLR